MDAGDWAGGGPGDQVAVVRIAGSVYEVEQVTDFAQLKTGMIVYVYLCSLCNREWCDSILGNLSLFRDGDAFEHAFEALPPCDGEHSEIDHETVATGDVYRVVDPVMDAENDTVARVLKLKVRT